MTSWINALPASWLTVSHLSLAFGLTKPTVLEKNALLVAFSTAARLPAYTITRKHAGSCQNDARSCVTRKTSTTSAAQVNERK